jgi:hypothetical protein
MIDIWEYGSTGSLINMVYNTYYGMGYSNNTLTKSRLEMNSYFYSSSTIAIWVHIWIRQKYNEWGLYALSRHIESWNISYG